MNIVDEINQELENDRKQYLIEQKKLEIIKMYDTINMCYAVLNKCKIADNSYLCNMFATIDRRYPEYNLKNMTLDEKLKCAEEIVNNDINKLIEETNNLKLELPQEDLEILESQLLLNKLSRR